MASYKSEAQKAKFQELVKEGKMSQEVFDRWQNESPSKLPDRAQRATKNKVQTVKKIKTIR